ncbi:MAG: NADH-quinone oxidoreductase subunit A [Deltaproteobacteria bacterium CG07_land_8_20_14_0_80_38_7]|nr:MAG: NADH-quinone oxidoreductase subunit A [Deltaproteobacteria bacterium CG07_land_8_20_14_0_80_38_7]
MGTVSFSLIIFFTLALAFAGGMILLSAAIGTGVKTEEKLKPYECGVDPQGSPHRKFSVKYFLVAILFIIFDVEVALLYPWALVFREFSDAGEGIIAFITALIFLGILFIGLIYAWGKKALEWNT